MRDFLLDTCTFLWLTGEPGELTPLIADICKDTSNTLHLSAVSAWEIELKFRQGKLPLSTDPPEFIQVFRSLHYIDSLPFTEGDALQHKQLPFYHKDPFDRMLICQALEHDMPILTPDGKIQQYEVETIW